MREIKFRGRWRDTGKLIPDFMEQYTIDALNAEEFIVEQYTGLKDKNGKEIYEGDIVMNQAQARREVRRTYYGEYRLFIGKHSDSFYERWARGTTWEVIGNIYENPEPPKEEQ